MFVHSAGYCNTTGVADPQCTQACSRCKKCVASVDYVRDVLNISTDDYMYAWGYSPANAFKAYKVCMLKAATAGSKTAPTGHCMAQEHAYCSLAPSYFQCGQLSGCQQTQACKRIDTHTCEASTSTASGVACKVGLGLCWMHLLWLMALQSVAQQQHHVAGSGTDKQYIPDGR